MALFDVMPRPGCHLGRVADAWLTSTRTGNATLDLVSEDRQYDAVDLVLEDADDDRRQVSTAYLVTDPNEVHDLADIEIRLAHDRFHTIRTSPTAQPIRNVAAVRLLMLVIFTWSTAFETLKVCGGSLLAEHIR